MANLKLSQLSDFLDEATYQKILDKFGSDDSQYTTTEDYDYNSTYVPGFAGLHKLAANIVSPDGNVLYKRGTNITSDVIKGILENKIPDFYFDELPEYEGGDFDSAVDYIHNNFVGAKDLPEPDDDKGWEEFYAEDSPFSEFETAFYNKYRDKVHDSDTDVTTHDVNGDDDTDVTTLDTNGNGEPDTSVVTADSPKEEEKAVEQAQKDLDEKTNDITSTGKKKKEKSPDNDTDTLSDESQKDIKHPASCDCAECQGKKKQTMSDERQKNIISALFGRRF